MLKDCALLKRLSWGLLMLLLTSCYWSHRDAHELPDSRIAIHEADALPYYDNNYLLSPGDKVEVTYHVDLERKENYQIEVGDQIRVEFFYYPQMDRTLNVRPDGRVTLPYKGDHLAFGKTPEELRAEIQSTYTDLLREPTLTVSLIRYGASIRELKKAISTSTRGQSRLALIGPDGRIKLPLLPKGLLVAGKTIEQVADQVNDSYNGLIPGMYTTSALYEATGNQVYVFGAVREPGYYNIKGPTTVLQAVALAGGHSKDAKISNTLLISRDEFSRPVGRLINLKDMLASGNIGKDLFVRQSDVIYVPTTRLGRATLLGQTLRAMIPVNFSFTYGITDAVDLAKPN